MYNSQLGSHSKLRGQEVMEAPEKYIPIGKSTLGEPRLSSTRCLTDRNRTALKK